MASSGSAGSHPAVAFVGVGRMAPIWPAGSMKIDGGVAELTFKGRAV
jgi:hypothetical protein